MSNHYRILEVDRHASDEVILAAYKSLTKMYQNDTKVFQKLNAAYEILSNPVKKAEYDKYLGNKDKTIGNYKLIKQLAEGGFGRTYLAEHTILGTKVCLKQAHKVSVHDEEMLREEAKSIWDLRHYGIPSIRDVVRHTDDSLILVMSYIPGPTLAEIVTKHKKLDPEHVAWITDRCINTLKYLHYHGTVHGDVKPQNIILQGENHSVVFVDYGLAAIRPSRDSFSKGYTPYFASQEQINGGPLLPESDFYSLGMTMIYALGGNIETRQVPTDTPAAMCDFIKKLIVRDVCYRPNWQKEDLHESFQIVREKSFGRKMSGMKPLPKM